jgi:hypothetical protein
MRVTANLKAKVTVDYRPGPALQMITNFIKNTGNYSLPTGYDTTRIPLLPDYLPDPPRCSAVPMTTNAFISVAKIILMSFVSLILAFH